MKNADDADSSSESELNYKLQECREKIQSLSVERNLDRLEILRLNEKLQEYRYLAEQLAVSFSELDTIMQTWTASKQFQSGVPESTKTSNLNFWFKRELDRLQKRAPLDNEVLSGTSEASTCDIPSDVTKILDELRRGVERFEQK